RDSREARPQEGVTSGLAATDLRTLLHHVCARDLPRGQKMPNMSTVAKMVTYILGHFGSLSVFIIDREPILLDQ
ncbi:MAG: hypothetical protein KH060_08380, partial [Collinsella sp.]|nr:hypothetical protein [Collinsella sp.]